MQLKYNVEEEGNRFGRGEQNLAYYCNGKF